MITTNRRCRDRWTASHSGTTAFREPPFRNGDFSSREGDDMSDRRDLVHILAEHAARLRHDDLPIEAREAAKKSVIDTIGVCLAASGLEPAVRAVIEIV